MEEGRNKMLQREEELFKNHEAAIGKSVQTLEIKFIRIPDDIRSPFPVISVHTVDG